MKFVEWLWNNKQMITGGATTTLASFGAAGIISATLAVKLAAVTGGLMTVFAWAHTYYFPGKQEVQP